MQKRFETLFLVLAVVAVVASFVFPPMAAYRGVYLALGAMLLALALRWRELGPVVAEPAYRLVGVAFLLFALTLPFIRQGWDDLLILVVMLPVPIGIGLVLLLQSEARFATPAVFASLCLLGAAAAVGVGLSDIYEFGYERAGGGNNPIHFAHIAVTLGYLSLIGLFGTKSRWRFLFLLGPVFGFEAALLAQSRGVMLGAAVVAVPVIALFAFSVRRKSVLWMGLVAVLVLCGAGFFARPDIFERAQGGVTQSVEVVRQLLFEQDTGVPAPGIDSSTDQRLAMLRAAGQAFMAAPLAGHGAGQIISTARSYYPERYKDMGNHLHSDISDFAVAGGVLGLAGYFLILVAPFAALFGVADPLRRRAILVGAIAISGCYFFNGLTNAVFGVLPQTALYGAALAVLVTLRRNETLPFQN